MRPWHRTPPCCGPGAVLAAALLAAAPAAAQERRVAGLPSYAPLNPIVASRSGLAHQPYIDRRPGWRVRVALDYGSAAEYDLAHAALFRLDAELLRLELGVARDLGDAAFVVVQGTLLGAYDGFADAWFDAYHRLLRYDPEPRASLPRDRFAWHMVLPDGRFIFRRRFDLATGDLALRLGVRHGSRLQSLLSLTLPTATAPPGYGRDAPSVSLVGTVRQPLGARLTHEGSLGVGYTPRRGPLAGMQRDRFASAASGLRLALGHRVAAYGSLFVHTPAYRGTGLGEIERNEFSTDFGLVLDAGSGRDWYLGLTEDFGSRDSAIDLILRVGTWR